MFYDIHRRYPRAYIHRHKLQKRYEGFNSQGPSEVVDLVMSIDSLIVNGEGTEREVTEIKIRGSSGSSPARFFFF